MDVVVNGIKYIAVDMIVIDSKHNNVLCYNVFDDKYKHITTITCNNKTEFINLFNNYLKQNK